MTYPSSSQPQLSDFAVEAAELCQLCGLKPIVPFQKSIIDTRENHSAIGDTKTIPLTRKPSFLRGLGDWVEYMLPSERLCDLSWNLPTGKVLSSLKYGGGSGRSECRHKPLSAVFTHRNILAWRAYTKIIGKRNITYTQLNDTYYYVRLYTW